MDAICRECLRIKCVFAAKFLVYRGKMKGSETFFLLILPEKIDSPRKQYTRFPLSTFKCCFIPGTLAKHSKFVTFFVYTIDEIPAIFSNLEPGAALAHSQYSRMLIAFSCYVGVE